MVSMNSCLSRVTAIDARRYYADQKHKFFLEMRCGRPCADQICADCLEKSPTSIIQWCRKVDHGLVSDPIPDRSHIYGGAWYEAGVLKWGAPLPDAIHTALEYQNKARALTVMTEVPSKVPSPSPPMESKRGRKPKAAIVQAKPEETKSESTPEETKSEEVIPQKEKPKRVRKPVVVKAVNPLMIKQEVVIPTYMEQTRELLDTDGYEIEYVKLSLFSVGDSTYFRDSKKNKLYQRIKEKTIGRYVGRYNARTETIHTDIPDSDDEQF